MPRPPKNSKRPHARRPESFPGLGGLQGHSSGSRNSCLRKEDWRSSKTRPANGIPGLAKGAAGALETSEPKATVTNTPCRIHGGPEQIVLRLAGRSLGWRPRCRQLALSDVEPRFTPSAAIGRFGAKSKRMHPGATPAPQVRLHLWHSRLPSGELHTLLTGVSARASAPRASTGCWDSWRSLGRWTAPQAGTVRGPAPL